MAELPDRMGWEGDFARELGKLLRAQQMQILELLGDPPNINNLLETMWREHGDALFQALEANYFGAYIAAAEHILNAQPIGVDWGLVNQEAANWARNNAQSLALDIVQTNRQNVGNAVAGFFEQQQTFGELSDRLASLFGPVRADLIASTEITRAAVQGELELVRQIGDQGVQLIAVWQTSNDDFVCPICSPLNQQRESPEGGFVPAGGAGPGIPSPPAHPRCRCWLDHEFVDIGVPIG